jgi:uncharacterized membrane protein YdjX (TVP38/TMEM64 family)
MKVLTAGLAWFALGLLLMALLQALHLLSGRWLREEGALGILSALLLLAAVVTSLLVVTTLLLVAVYGDAWGLLTLPAGALAPVLLHGARRLFSSLKRKKEEVVVIKLSC